MKGRGTPEAVIRLVMVGFDGFVFLLVFLQVLVAVASSLLVPLLVLYSSCSLLGNIAR